MQNDGTETTAYNNTVSALSAVPSGSVVLLTGVNDEVTGGMVKAAQTRHVTNYLANSFGGDSYGFSQVCSNSHYVGAWYLEPMVWGQDSLTAILDQINGVKVPGTIGVVGEEVTKSSSDNGLQVDMPSQAGAASGRPEKACVRHGPAAKSSILNQLTDRRGLREREQRSDREVRSGATGAGGLAG